MNYGISYVLKLKRTQIPEIRKKEKNALYSYRIPFEYYPMLLNRYAERCVLGIDCVTAKKEIVLIFTFLQHCILNDSCIRGTLHISMKNVIYFYNQD